MKLILLLVFIGISLTQCEINPSSKEKEVTSSLEQSIRSDLKHLKFDFYSDARGVIYHRIIDFTSGGIEGVYQYNSYVRFYSGEKENYQTIELKEILDLPTFKKSETKDPTGRILYFEDMKYSYSLYSVAEGAIFQVEQINS